jgi:hypothetical protein
MLGNRRPTLWAAVLLLGLTGCATLRATVDGYATGASGISRPQQRQRDALAAADYQLLLERHEDDRLLDALTVGVASYYASQFARSASVLDTAALIADDRITASLSKDALALVTNDMARPYQPRRTERLFIPYYAMLAWARLGDWENAAVEARRLSALLALYAGDRDDAERSLHATLHQLAGIVFERAGDRGEADVAYRVSRALSALPPDSVTSTPGTGEGELLVVVERGFVAHRTNEQIAIFRGGERQDFAARSHRRDEGDELPLKIAFPAVQRSPRPWGEVVRVRVDDGAPAAASLIAMVDGGTIADERRERAAIAARAVARALAKYSLAKAVTDKQGEATGDLAKLGAYLLERADVRSWHLLPQELALVRVRAAAGRHVLRLEIGDGTTVHHVEAGTVEVGEGLVTIVPVRIFRDSPPPSPSTVLASRDSVCARVSCR